MGWNPVRSVQKLGSGLNEFAKRATPVVSVVVGLAMMASGNPYGASLVLYGSVYGQNRTKKIAERDMALKRKEYIDAYNASLKDRMATVVASDMPYVYVYGRARVGSTVVAILASGAKDEYKHLICVHAAHECDAFEEIYINKVALGALDADGFPTFGKYVGKVRIKKHLGTPSDPADATLISECPDKWTSNHVLRGFCYTYIRLDLNEQEFQGGLPAVEVLLRGKKLYDTRTATTSWSQNPALVLYDYLTSDICGVPAADLPTAQFNTAANVCDEAVSGIGNRYTFNGTVSADQDPKAILDVMLQSMAGTLVMSTWDVTAGKYVAPILALTQEDIVGSVSIVPSASDASMFNGIKGRYISSETLYTDTDFKPYQNASYVAADGGEQWQNMDFPFTDAVQRVHNLARIATEDARNGYTVTAGFSFKAWDLKVGYRMTLTSALFGWSAKVFRVMGKSYSLSSPVVLTLKEDAASIWDVADAVTADSTPNTNLPDPFSVGTPGNVHMTEQLYKTTGSAGVKNKAILTWAAPAGLVMDYEIEYKLNSSSTWLELFGIFGERYEFLDIAPGYYDFRVKARNYLGAVGSYTATKSFTVYGLTAAPANVTGFSVRAMAGMALATWNRTTDIDVKIGGDVVLRWSPLTAGATWEASVILPDGELNGDASSAIVPLATGTYFAKFVDSTGHYSDAAASFVATEALVSGWTTVTTSTQHTAFSGAKTNIALDVDAQAIKLDGALLIDDWSTSIDGLGYIDSVGGISASGTYEFSAVMDLTTVASRRFHAHLKALSYDADDLIDSRPYVDTWEDIDGAAVNDCDATVYASVSDDGVLYSDWTPFMVSDFKCRYAKFRALLQSGSVTHNIKVSELSVAAKVLT